MSVASSIVIFVRAKAGAKPYQFHWVLNDEPSFGQLLNDKIIPESVHKGVIVGLRPLGRDAVMVPRATFMSTPPSEGATYDVVFETESMSLPELFALVTATKDLLDSKRPLKDSILAALQHEDDITISCHSTGLEGNTFTMEETRQLLTNGIVSGSNKAIMDAFEVYDHNQAMKFIRALFLKKKKKEENDEKEEKEEKANINEDTMLQVQRVVLQRSKPLDGGVYRKHAIFVPGTHFVFPAAEEIPAQMKAFYAWLAEDHSEQHPLEFAVEAHLRFVTVHPFADGNGRSARLLLNLLLQQRGFPPCCPTRETRDAYMDAVRLAQLGGSSEPLMRMFANSALEALKRHLTAATASATAA